MSQAYQVDLAIAHGIPVYVMPAYDTRQRKIYGARLVKRRGVWLFPAFAPFHARVIHDIGIIYPDATYTPAATQNTLDQGKVTALVAAGDLDGYTPLFKNYAHQDEALSHAIWNVRYGLFLGRGLGKTKITVDLIRHLKRKDPSFRCLILALRVNLYTWANEMEKFTGGELAAMPLVASSPAQRVKKLAELVEADPVAVVITYDTARVFWEEIRRDYGYTMLVCDESHKLRSPKSQQTQAVLELAKKAGRRLLLTGTPSLGNPMHMWGQLKVLGDFVVPSQWDYGKQYLVRSHYNQKIIVGYKNMRRLNGLVSSVSIHKDAEECIDLPERVFQDIRVPPTRRQRSIYNRMLKDGVAELAGKKVLAEEPIVRLTKMSQISSGFLYHSFKDPTICDACPHVANCVEKSIRPYTKLCKVDTVDPGGETLWIPGATAVLDATVSCVQALIDEGGKVVVWAVHRAVLDKLYEVLSAITPEDKSPLKVLRFDSTAESPHLVEKEFNESPEARILVAQITMGIGVTFNAAAMVYAEVAFALDTWLQSLDRNWGIRAEGHARLVVQTIAVQGSIFDSTFKLLQAKIDMANTMAKKPVCVGCDRIIACLGNGTEPFEEGCKYDQEVKKVKISMEMI